MSNSSNKSSQKKKKFFSLSFHFKVWLTAEWCVCYQRTYFSGTSLHVDRFQETFCRDHLNAQRGIFNSYTDGQITDEWIFAEFNGRGNKAWVICKQEISHVLTYMNQPTINYDSSYLIDFLTMDPWVKKPYCHHCTQLDAQHLCSVVCLSDLLHHVGVRQIECGLRQKLLVRWPGSRRRFPFSRTGGVFETRGIYCGEVFFFGVDS